MISLIEKELLAKNPAAGFNFVKLRGGGRKVAFLAFLNKGKRPTFYLKTGTFPSDNFLIESEFDKLKLARNSLAGGLRNSLPQPIDLFKMGERLFSLEEAVSGRPVSDRAGGRDLKRIFVWLVAFHQSGLTGKRKISQEFLINLLSQYQWLISALKNDGRFLDRAKDFVRNNWSFGEMEIPVIKQHGDFHFGNLIFQDEALKVVDWANYQRVDLPAYDLIFFLKRQKNTNLAENNPLLLEYFKIFSLAKEILPFWLKFMSLIDGLERWSRGSDFISPLMVDKFFEEELV